MELSNEIKDSVHKSVLCWLATSSVDNIPNVSPKEIFSYCNDKIIIANIASPKSVENIRMNKNVCISFTDILVQKGFQIKGEGRIVTNKEADFENYKSILEEMTEGKFPFHSVIEIVPLEFNKIIAPRYFLFPETTEEEQIESAKKTYGFIK
ncbi:pyridoxamine 5'-phosphate oxidase family protein [Elizabethkingia anophelis]|uniref:pyridoxamine 5'-phosphate oxidase family protein n=1 Tax=Elizabethkingia anophelis TaxID=1117645 RepID=UPI000B35BA33|nr:pyridoxamine 5'-phosphate oxidase family protein [Elizabethkingia anophelis]